MRYVFGVMALASLYAMVVQYNDPDGALWMIYYALPTLWCGLAAARPNLFAHATVRTLLAVSTVALIVVMIAYWPTAAGFWHHQVWEMGKTEAQAAAIAEASREGMGLMIASAMMLAVTGWAFLRRERPQLAAG